MLSVSVASKWPECPGPYCRVPDRTRRVPQSLFLHESFQYVHLRANHTDLRSFGGLSRS